MLRRPRVDDDGPTLLLVTEWLMKKPTVTSTMPRMMTGRAADSVSPTPASMIAKPATSMVRRPNRPTSRPANVEDTQPMAKARKMKLICVWSKPNGAPASRNVA